MYTRIFVFFTVILKNRNIKSKIQRSKVTDYAALKRQSQQKTSDFSSAEIFEKDPSMTRNSVDPDQSTRVV